MAFYNLSVGFSHESCELGLLNCLWLVKTRTLGGCWRKTSLVYFIFKKEKIDIFVRGFFPWGWLSKCATRKYNFGHTQCTHADIEGSDQTAPLVRAAAVRTDPRTNFRILNMATKTYTTVSMHITNASECPACEAQTTYFSYSFPKK